MRPLRNPYACPIAALWVILTAAGIFLPFDVAGAPEDFSTPPQRETTAQKLFSSPTGKAGLETALSIDLVNIDTGFSGADLLLFGSVRAGTDIVIVVRGPSADATIQHKQRRAGIWIHTQEQEYKGIPTYYHLAANRPVTAFVPPQDQQRFDLGLAIRKALPDNRSGFGEPGPGEFDPGKSADTATDAATDPATDFGQGLIENMRKRGFYSQSEHGVTFIGSRLFRTDVRLPPDVPVGLFTVDVYAFRDGLLQDMRSSDFWVGKIGIGAALYSFAHAYPFLYGIVAVVMAIGLGALSAAIFRTL